MGTITAPIIQLFTILFYQPTYNLLMFFYGLTHSFPWAIVLVTLAVRAALIPIFMRQLKSSKAMQEISPQVQEIQRKYRSEPAVMQQNLSALYKEKGVNPYASCLPTLIQMPFLYGLYGAFNAILNVNRSKPLEVQAKTAEAHNTLYPFLQPLFGPHGLQKLPETSFVFGIDLAHPDPHYVLPVLAAVLTFIQIRMSVSRAASQPKTTGAPDPNQASMKMMQYIMPFFTLFIGLRFAAGLALYWVIGTLFTIIQQYFVNGRSWGPLLDGIPGLKGFAQPVPAIVNAGPGSGAIGRTSRVRVAEEPVKPKTQRALPAPKAQDNTDQYGDERNTPRQETPLRPTTTKPTNTRPINNKKDAVRLVTSNNGNGAAAHNGATKPVVVARTMRPTSAPARVSTTNKPKSTASSRPRKRGR